MTHLVPLEGTTATSLQLPADLPYEQWRDAGLMYARLGKAVQWWIGDWLKYGEDRYGEEFAQAVNDLGYSEESLRGFLWVASRIPPHVRRPTLSWSHHQAVAGQDNAGEWLDRAEGQQLSVSRLKEAIRGPAKEKPVCGAVACPMRKEEAA